MLLQIKPRSNGMKKILILEAMDCVIVEVYGIYSRICNGIARVLLNICSAEKTEASVALKIFHKSREQGEELSMYIEECKKWGVVNAWKCPKIELVPDEDFWEVERIISGVSETDTNCSVSETGKEVVVAREDRLAEGEGDSKGNCLKTVVTNEWEVFDEDLIKFSGEIGCDMGKRRNGGEDDPFAASLIPYPPQSYEKNQEVPDLISFL